MWSWLYGFRPPLSSCVELTSVCVSCWLAVQGPFDRDLTFPVGVSFGGALIILEQRTYFFRETHI